MPRLSQLDLGFGVTVPEPLLRDAYRRCRLPMPFEQAMEVDAIRLCLRRVALIAAARKHRRKR